MLAILTESPLENEAMARCLGQLMSAQMEEIEQVILDRLLQERYIVLSFAPCLGEDAFCYQLTLGAFEFIFRLENM